MGEKGTIEKKSKEKRDLVLSQFRDYINDYDYD